MLDTRDRAEVLDNSGEQIANPPKSLLERALKKTRKIILFICAEHNGSPDKAKSLGSLIRTEAHPLFETLRLPCDAWRCNAPRYDAKRGRAARRNASSALHLNNAETFFARPALDDLRLTKEPGQLGGGGSLGARQSRGPAANHPPFHARMRLPISLMLAGRPAEFLIRSRLGNDGLADSAREHPTLFPQRAIARWHSGRRSARERPFEGIQSLA
jgi:hypothetical protein